MKHEIKDYEDALKNYHIMREVLMADNVNNDSTASMLAGAEIAYATLFGVHTEKFHDDAYYYACGEWKED